MTREQAKSAIRMSVVINAQYINSLNKADDIINQIYDDREAQLKAKDEEIAELEEAMKPKTCEGCKYDAEEMSKECYMCSRNVQDQYEPKDKQCGL